MRTLKRNLAALLCVMIILCLCSCKEQISKSTRTDAKCIYGTKETEYRYDILSERLVLRTESYSDIIFLNESEDSQREPLGFWPEDDTEQTMFVNDGCFRIVQKTEDSMRKANILIRYDERGNSEQLLETTGYLSFIDFKGTSLFLYEHNSEENREAFYRIDSIFTDNYSVVCLKDIPCASSIDNNSQNVIAMHGEWIYFLYTDRPTAGYSVTSPNLWLYRLSVTTKEIERVEEVYSAISGSCRTLTDLFVYENYFMIEGVHEGNVSGNRMLYCYDPEKNTCKLLCNTTSTGSEKIIKDNKCYHIHEISYGETYWAVSKIDGGANCEKIGSTMDSSLSHFRITSGVKDCGEYLLYGSATNEYTYYIPFNKLGVFQEFMTTYIGTSSFYYDGITYLFINGAVLYTDLEHSGKWYDSGTRYVKHEWGDSCWFAEAGGSVYFVEYELPRLVTFGFVEDYSSPDAKEGYRSIKIVTDFKNEVSSDSSLLWANIQETEPKEAEGYPLLDYSIKDSYGNSYAGVVFDPARDMPESVIYEIGGKTKYMTATIGVDRDSLSKASGKIVIYADDQLVYESPTLDTTSEPIGIHVDVKNAKKVLVKAVSDNEFNPYQPMPNIRIVLDNAIFHDLSVFPYKRLLKNKTTQEKESLLVATSWYFQGYRLSDTFTFKFYANGSYSAQNHAGAIPMTGTYTFDGTTLTLSNGIVYIYNPDTQVFTCTTKNRFMEQDYVDENGVYHAPVYDYGTLVPEG